MVEFAQLTIDFIAVEPDSVQFVNKGADLTNRCCIIRINDGLQKRQCLIGFIRCCGSGHSMAVYTKWRFQHGVFMNGFNTDVMKPVLKKLYS
ncbi:Uncharacterised protein [Serratia liquefaciens]|nr:Uncharacterised protein [Serratia liquefaciens]